VLKGPLAGTANSRVSSPVFIGGMHVELEPYLFFQNGKCEEALNFYKGIFGGEITSISRWSEMPPDMEMPKDMGNRIMHANFESPSIKFMGSDARPTTTYGDGPISLSLGTTDEAEAKRLFDGLAQGGKVEVPLDKAFWGALFGMLTDKYGIDWMVNCTLDK
jgi:PhnB protein